MSDAHAPASYRSYWIAWLILLGLTLIMVTMSHPAVLLAGIAVKSSLIALWFMHLRWEPRMVWAIAAFGACCLLFFYFGVSPEFFSRSGSWVRNAA